MDETDRRGRARRAVEGYPSGPAAPVRATAHALAKVDDARAVVLVEGVSDQIALETAAAGHGRDLAAERIVVVPIGGAHAIGRVLTMLTVPGRPVRLAGLCDLAEEEIVRRALAAGGAGPARSRADLERLGFFVCADDLEDELIRAVGVPGVQAVVAAQGDRRALRSLQGRPAWRGRDVTAQLRRFLAGGARRKQRYARLLVEAAVDRDALPRPLAALLTAV